MKMKNIIPSLMAMVLTVGLVGCKQKTDPAEAAQDSAYGENAIAQTTNALAQAGEAIKETATNVVVAVAAAVPNSTAPAAAGTVRYNAQPGGSKATVNGDSSIKHWSMESGVISGYMEVDANFPESALTAAAAKPVVSVSVPVRTLKSGKATMDEKMQLTMSMTNYPRIEYQVIELKPKSPAGTTGPLQFDAVGILTIVGKPVTNTMPVTIEKVDGKLKVVGSAAIKLTQFEIKPPIIAIPLFADITVYDDLKVDFTWTLAPKK